MRHGGRMHTSRNQARDMRHVDHEFSADFVGYPPHAGKIDDAGVSAESADNHFWAFANRDLLHLVVIDGFSVFAHAIRNDLVHLAGEVQRMAVREVSTVSEVQTHDGVAWLQE